MRLRSLAVLVVGILVLAPMGGWAGEGGKLKRRGAESPGTVTKSQAARANGIGADREGENHQRPETTRGRRTEV